MVKLAKQYYLNKDGTKKINCYHLTISKQILEKSKIADDSNLVIIPKKNKLIIEKVPNEKVK